MSIFSPLKGISTAFAKFGNPSLPSFVDDDFSIDIGSKEQPKKTLFVYLGKNGNSDVVMPITKDKCPQGVGVTDGGKYFVEDGNFANGGKKNPKYVALPDDIQRGQIYEATAYQAGQIGGSVVFLEGKVRTDLTPIKSSKLPSTDVDALFGDDQQAFRL